MPQEPKDLRRTKHQHSYLLNAMETRAMEPELMNHWDRRETGDTIFYQFGEIQGEIHTTLKLLHTQFNPFNPKIEFSYVQI